MNSLVKCLAGSLTLLQGLRPRDFRVKPAVTPYLRTVQVEIASEQRVLHTNLI